MKGQCPAAPAAAQGACFTSALPTLHVVFHIFASLIVKYYLNFSLWLSYDFEHFHLDSHFLRNVCLYL